MAPSDFDSDLDLIGTPGAAVSLRTADTYPRRPGDYISKQTRASYKPDAKGERFLQFIDEITDGDTELAAYLQTVLGYAITGHYREQSLFWFYGPTAGNGKDTLFNIVKGVIGDYGVWGASGMLTQRKFQPHHAEVADINGARLVMHKELDEGQKLDAGRVKEFTGSAVIKTHFMAENWFDMANTHTHIFAVNHLPPISSDDQGMLRRMVVIPFNVKFWDPDDPAFPENDPDVHIQDPLLEAYIIDHEAEAVLAWLVEGAMRWYRDGALHQPPAVKGATLQYLEKASDVWVWLEEATMRDPDAFMPTAELHAAYSRWSEQRGRPPMDAAVFGKRIAGFNYEPKQQKVNGMNTRGFRGLRFRESTITVEQLMEMAKVWDRK